MELTQEEKDFIASTLLYAHRRGIFNKDQDKQAFAIIDKLGGD